jgi:hypothetical protein
MKLCPAACALDIAPVTADFAPSIHRPTVAVKSMLGSSAPEENACANEPPSLFPSESTPPTASPIFPLIQFQMSATVVRSSSIRKLASNVKCYVKILSVKNILPKGL